MYYFFIISVVLFLVASCSQPASEADSSQEPGSDTAWLKDKTLQQGIQPQSFQPDTAARDSSNGKYFLTVREGEIDTFVQALALVQNIRIEAMGKMDKAILAEGVELKEFAAYMKKVQTNKKDQLDVSPQRLQKLQNAQKVVDAIAAENEKEMEKAIESTGMEMDRYIHIGMVSEQNKELAKSIEQRLVQLAKPAKK